MDLFEHFLCAKPWNLAKTLYTGTENGTFSFSVLSNSHLYKKLLRKTIYSPSPLDKTLEKTFRLNGIIKKFTSTDMFVY